MSTIRFGIVGLGNAGRMHLKTLADGVVSGASVTAVACRPDRVAELGDVLPAGVRVYDDAQSMFAGGQCDAVLVATPHPLHPAQVIAACRTGLHVLCEKPAGVRHTEARDMADAADAAGVRCALNFNRRAAPAYEAVRRLMHDGTLGTIRRAAWTSTAWLRVQSYYDSSPWRGTWAGEGGGLLMNQLPHVLDLWQWILGMPVRLRARCAFGRYHDIEVEDEAHVLAEYPDGAAFTLVASTGEAPGIERLEIVGDRGTVILDHRTLTVTRLDVPVSRFIRESAAGFDWPGSTVETTVFADDGDLVAVTLHDFVARLRDGRPMLAPMREGIASLELANAILLSQWDEAWVNLPIDAGRFENQLADRSRPGLRSRPSGARIVDLTSSYK